MYSERCTVTESLLNIIHIMWCGQKLFVRMGTGLRHHVAEPLFDFVMGGGSVTCVCV